MPYRDYGTGEIKTSKKLAGHFIGQSVPKLINDHSFFDVNFLPVPRYRTPRKMIKNENSGLFCG
jgi:hypothetical protein